MTKKTIFFSETYVKPAVLLLFCLWFVQLAGQSDSPRKFRLPYDLREVSGLVVADADSLWWHNDGGNAAELFLTNGRGEIQSTINLSTIINQDWEDLTQDDQGRLFIGDFGDNRRVRSEVKVYCYDPKQEKLDSIRFSYSDNHFYDVEAFFWHQDSLHLFTKSRIQRADLTTYHFVVSARPGQHTAELRDSLQLRKRAVTAAAIHPETGQVALLAYYFKFRLGFIPYSAANVYYFTDYPEGHFLKGKVRSRRISLFLATQYESLDFLTAERLLVASEQTVFIKPKAKRIRWKR